MSNNNSTDLSRFNDKYLKCIVTKRKSSMSILKDQGAVIIYQNSGYNHLYLGNEFVAAGWGFKSKEELNTAEYINSNYSSDIENINNGLSNLNNKVTELESVVSDLNDKINPIVYVYDENGEAEELNNVFFKGIPAFYDDFEINSIEKIIVYNNNQIIKITDDTNIISLPIGSKIHQISYTINCNIHDTGGIKDINMSYFENSDKSLNKQATPISIDSTQWANLEKNKVINIVHDFIVPFFINKDEDLKVINNILITINKTSKEQYKKYPELTLENSKFTIYSLENIIREHTIELEPLIIHPVPEVRWYMTDRDTNYSFINAKNELNNVNSSYRLKGNIKIENYVKKEFKDIFIPIDYVAVKIIDLFIPISFELHEIRFVCSTSEYNWTGATGVLKYDPNDNLIVLKNSGNTYIKYNLYQVRIGDGPLRETGRLMLRLYIKNTYLSNDIFEGNTITTVDIEGVPTRVDMTDIVEPENWNLLYNEEFTRTHWISYKTDMDELHSELVRSEHNH